MKKLVCAVIVKDDKVFCCKSKTEVDKWAFPYSSTTHEVLFESKKNAIEDAITGDYQMEMGFYYPNDSNGTVELSAELCRSNSGKVNLVEDRENKWLEKDELDLMDWETFCYPIAQCLKDWLMQRAFSITKTDGNGVEKTIYSGKLSRVEQTRKFHTVIKEYSEEYKTTREYAVFSLYDELKQKVAQETFHQG